MVLFKRGNIDVFLLAMARSGKLHALMEFQMSWVYETRDIGNLYELTRLLNCPVITKMLCSTGFSYPGIIQRKNKSENRGLLVLQLT